MICPDDLHVCSCNPTTACPPRFSENEQARREIEETPWLQEAIEKATIEGLLIPADSITTKKEAPPTTVANLTIPSITVGTQVRLTGVVRRVQPNGAIGVDVYVGCQNGLHWFRPEEVEVIRQPFKRGEVVYFEDHDIACVVLEDEQNGRMLLIEAGEGKYATYVDADQYERRP